MSKVLTAHTSRSDDPSLGRLGAAIEGIGTSLPPHRWTQAEAYELLAREFDYYRRPRVKQMFENSGVESRYFSLPPERYNALAGAGEFHELFRRTAPGLAVEAARRAIEQAGLSAKDLGMVVVATCTGYLCPGLTAYLVRELDLSREVQRADLVGMGCAGALPALQRGFDYVKGESDKTALVVTVEVCSACCFVDDNLETVVGNAICGDGAAAVVLRGATSGVLAPTILAFQALIDTDCMEAVGLENVDGKHRIVLSKEIRKAAGPAVARVVDLLLQKSGLERDSIDHWVFHAGGAAVMANIERSMEFSDDELRWSRAVFREHGNMSSPTALFVLNELQKNERPQSGELGVMLALGPGLATEAALLQW